MKIKTIDIKAKEWFDKANGNSYFSAQITVNFQDENEKTKLPFQYGYESHFISQSMEELKKEGLIKTDNYISLSRYCRENGIFLNTSKEENCLKKDVVNFGTN